jgi:hypothetical protein
MVKGQLLCFVSFFNLCFLLPSCWFGVRLPEVLGWNDFVSTGWLSSLLLRISVFRLSRIDRYDSRKKLSIPLPPFLLLLC